MLRVMILMGAMAVCYAAFAVLYRDKTCDGNCGACGGTCQANGDTHDTH